MMAPADDSKRELNRLGTTGSPPPKSAVAAGRRPLRQTVAFQIGAVIALAAFILALGDVRRKNTPMSLAGWYANQLTLSQGQGKILPLNFGLEVPPDQAAKARRFTHLSPEEARALRSVAGDVLVAYTAPIKRYLAPDGRAVVLFNGGSFRAAWLGLAEFDRMHHNQRQAIEERQPRSDG